MAGENWLTGYSYRRSHLINQQSGAGTDYQVKMKLIRDLYASQLQASAGVGTHVRPSAIYSSPLTIFTWLNTSGKKVKIQAFNHDTSTWSSIYDVSGALADGDLHRTPAIGIDPNNKLIVFYNVQTLYYKISSSTIAQIASDMTLLSGWGSQTQYGVVTDVYYPNVISSNPLRFFYVRQTTQWSNVTCWTDTFDGSSWSGPVKFRNHVDDGFYPHFTPFGSYILMDGVRRESDAGGKGADVYFCYSDDGGSTWKLVDGTSLTLPLTQEDLISNTGLSTLVNEAILDENNKPCVIIGYRNTSGGEYTGDYNVKVVQYSTTLGNSGSWTVSNCIDGDSNPIIYDGWYESIAFFIGIKENRPTFITKVKVDSTHHYYAHYVRQSGQTTVFDLDYMDTSLGDAGTGATNSSRILTIRNKNTSGRFEVITGELYSGTQRVFVRQGWEADTTTTKWLTPTNPTKINSDFSDIIITESNGDTPLSMWIQSTHAEQYIYVWVKITDNLTNGNSTIYIYYGKSDATTTSDIIDTMIVGDDGVEGNLTSTKSGTTVIDHSGGYLRSTTNNSTDDGWIIGKDLDDINNFQVIIDSTSGSGLTLDCVIPPILGLMDFASFPSPMVNTSWNPQLRFGVMRRGANESNPSRFYIFYIDATGAAKYWTGTAWGSITYFGGAGSYEVQVYDDGTNYYADILQNGVSVLTAVASIAKTSVKAFSDGRILCSSEPYTNYYYENHTFDYWFIKKYVTPEPTHSTWGEEEEISIKPSSGSIATLMREMGLI